MYKISSSPEIVMKNTLNYSRIIQYMEDKALYISMKKRRRRLVSKCHIHTHRAERKILRQVSR